MIEGEASGVTEIDQAKWKLPNAPKQMTARHPQLEFKTRHGKVHVHLEDNSMEYPSGRVLWDATYNLGGTNVLKGHAKPLGGDVQKFHPMCPPKKGPAHWYTLTVTREPAKGTDVKL